MKDMSVSISVYEMKDMSMRVSVYFMKCQTWAKDMSIFLYLDAAKIRRGG